MTVVVVVTRATTRYGVPVRERLKVEAEGGEMECTVRVLKAEGSKARTVYSDVPWKDLPGRLQELAREELGGVPGEVKPL